MPTLRNPRHERFAQELATGKSADAAYVLAGYKENRSNAARLGADQNIQARVADIQSLGAERAAITIETLIAEAEAARSDSLTLMSFLPGRDLPPAQYWPVTVTSIGGGSNPARPRLVSIRSTDRMVTIRTAYNRSSV